MTNHNGFSLMELLIALLLTTTVCLGFINEQFLIKRRLNQIEISIKQFIQESNNTEQRFTKFSSS